jgi:signal peptidase I
LNVIFNVFHDLERDKVILLQTRAHVCHFSIGTLVVALIVRTWLVMGLIEPVTVAGSSMAPNLRGPHVSVTCKKCELKFDIGAEFDTASVVCPRCDKRQTLSDPPAVERGDRLVIDRMAFQFRNPRRWEPIVFRSPVDGQLTVKRVVGLPGETIQLRDGEVVINGKPATRDITGFRATRQVVHLDADPLQGNGGWEFKVISKQPLMTEIPYNNGVTQRLFPVANLGISANVRFTEGARMTIIIAGEELVIAEVGEAELEIYTYQNPPQVFFDGTPIIPANLKLSKRPVNPLVPIEISVSGGQVEIADLTVYRDTYYASLNEEHAVAEPMEPIKLKDDEIFVLGDNVPVSVDSRHWGSVPLRLLVGRPIGVR